MVQCLYNTVCRMVCRLSQVVYTPSFHVYAYWMHTKYIAKSDNMKQRMSIRRTGIVWRYLLCLFYSDVCYNGFIFAGLLLS